MHFLKKVIIFLLLTTTVTKSINAESWYAPFLKHPVQTIIGGATALGTTYALKQLFIAINQSNGIYNNWNKIALPSIPLIFSAGLLLDTKESYSPYLTGIKTCAITSCSYLGWTLLEMIIQTKYY